MAKTLEDRIRLLESQIDTLKSELNNQRNKIKKYKKPHSTNKAKKKMLIAGDPGHNSEVLTVWNDAEAKRPALNEKPDEPNRAYNRHMHSRYSGGALAIGVLEIVEYDIDWDEDEARSKHSPGYWQSDPPIKKVQNAQGENVSKIGNLDINFNPETGKWEAGGSNIDVEDTQFLKYNASGQIETDGNGNEKSAPLFVDGDTDKQNVVWDSDNQTWRFYAVYAD